MFMLKRFAALFNRYVDLHDSVEGKPISCDESGARIDHVVQQRGRLVIRGSVKSGPVRLTVGEMNAVADLEHGGQFTLSLPRRADSHLPAVVQLGDAGEFRLKLPDWRLTRFRLLARFLVLAVRLSPTVFAWRVSGNPRYRNAIKRRLGFVHIATCGEISGQMFDPHSDGLVSPPPPTSTIVVPVYNARTLVEDCLERVQRNTDVPWQMVVIDDCSTDPEIRPMLRKWTEVQNAQQPGKVCLIELDQNRGFVGAVNAGLSEIAKGTLGAGPVILLNTDAMVPKNWLSRLIAPLLRDQSVASVTPMSNDAEIFSIPAICQKQILEAGQADRIDKVAAQLKPDACEADAPTGVGFCMALSRRFLSEVSSFDEIFGRGYGEEVDWCQRVRAVGGRHVGVANLFVEHRGGASFGEDEKRAAVAANNRIISERYPGYDGEVQRFILDDPLLSPRLALGLAWVGSLGADPTPIYLAHSLGGGADLWLRAKIESSTGPVIVLRVGGERRWQLELHTDGRLTAGMCDDFDLIRSLLAPIKNRRIIYSCGVGDSDPFTLPDCLLRLRESDQDKIEILFHDYLPISSEYTLLDADGAFRGPVTPSHISRQDRKELALNHQSRSGGRPVSLAQWQAQWGRLLASADEIRVFSEASKTLVAAAWPEVEDRIRVRPHTLLQDLPALDSPKGAPVLAVLGNIAPHKGAALLQELAAKTKGAKLSDLVLLGQIDPAFPLPKNVRQHGRYRVEDLPELVRHYGITHWLIPSVWPETFSFATHEALATGLPVFAFDIGAQGDAVTEAPNGHPISYKHTGDLAQDVLSSYLQVLEVSTDRGVHK